MYNLATVWWERLMGILPGQPAITATTTFRITSFTLQAMKTSYLTYLVSTPLILGDNNYPGFEITNGSWEPL
jgi:hypothetical protein